MLIFLFILLYLSFWLFQVSSAQSLAGSSITEFECDGTERLNTLLSPGGQVKNTGTVSIGINVEGGTAPTAQPAGPGCIILVPPAAGKDGEWVNLPVTCRKFSSVSTAGATYLSYRGLR